MRWLAGLPPRPATRRVAAWVAAVVLVRGILVATYNVLGDLQRGASGTWALRLVDELSAVAIVLPLFVVVVAGVLRWPLRSPKWRQHLPALVALFLVYSVTHTVAMEVLRSALYPLIGLRRDIGADALWLAIGHEMPNDLFYFSMVAVAVELWRFWWEAVTRERREVELERSLAEAQLATLRLQLQPHFLFNALNTISSVMYENPRAADTMLGELSELLRTSLRTHRDDVVPLGEELGIARRYVNLQRARFGDRLQVQFDVPEECLTTRVPVLLLQPLIENAVRHGGVERTGAGHVHVRARRENGQLTLEVHDDGRGGAPPTSSGNGLGLRATSERLRLLYGDLATFTAGPVPDGWRVRIVLPLQGIET